MRIAFIITRAEPIGGAQVHVRDLALALKKMGSDVYVITGSDGLIVRQMIEDGINVIVVTSMVRPISPIHDIKAFFSLRSRILQIRPNVISTHSSKAGWLGRLVGRSTRIPTLFTAHGWAFSEGVPRFQKYLYLSAERMMGNFSEMIITVSNYDRRQAIEKGVVARDKVRVIHNGMPHLDANYLANPASQPPTIVMVARFMQQKDHATLLKALSTLQDRQWRVQFIGDGPLESAVRALSDNLGLLGRVEFLGERRDVDRILSNAQVFVLASHWEGLSRSTIEALRAGLPCVISDVGGMNELISEGVEGYLVPRNDSHLLAECLKRLIENPDLRARFGNAARQRYEREFQFSPMFEKTLKVYDTLLQRGSLRT